MAGSTSSIQNLVLFVFLCISTSAFNGGKNGVICNARERQALLKFKHALNVSDNVLLSWVGEDCCSWEGVTCNDKTVHVIKLNLSYAISEWPVFTGEIDPSLLELKHLTHLNLSNNYFGSKPIPMFFGLFKKLRYLDLSGSYLGGIIPQELGNLSSLRHLDLNRNNLRVNNLHWLSHLSSLQHLGMSSLNLSRVANWLQEVNMLSSLSVLDLSFCHISDVPTLPYLNFTSLVSLDLSDNSYLRVDNLDWLGNISSLRHLYLGAYYDYIITVNNLHWLSRLSSLQHLYMSYVNLSKASNWLQEVNMLPSLSVLHLRSCQLSDSSTLPNYLNFTSLTSLDLSYSSFSSEFLYWLFNLHDLNLSSTNIKGFKPNAPCRLSNLQELYLCRNKMDGDLNGFLQVLSMCGMKDGRMSPITSLDLSYNNFSGILLPESLGQLPNLEHLEIENNALEGVLSEAHLANLTRLDYLDISSNSFVLNVPVDWIPPSQLKHIFLGSCHLGPQFPMWVRHQKGYKGLSLSNNQISDIVPHWFWNLSSEAYLIDLSCNQIRGQIPNSLNLSVGQLDLSSNLFSGPLISIVVPTYYLALSKNNLSGSIPSSICESQSLRILDLSENGFTGQIPSCLEQLRRLQILDLSENQLSGDIPIGLICYVGLEWLQLRNNNFSGGLPSSIGIQDHFLFIDLSQNRLSGLLPAWTSKNLPRLRVLNLRSNMFHGNIPAQLSQLPSLQILDLSDNRLSGNIPSSFGNFSGMKLEENQSHIIWSYTYRGGLTYDEQVKLVMKRNELEYTKTIPLLVFIDLSRNDLSGEIPEELTSLNGLQSLNFSANQLVGKIPESISKLRQLEALDLSSNHLSGAIPANIEALTFLGSLNFSYNNLSGPIPPGNHLQTLLVDPSTYMGNRDLCGPPLAKACQEEVPHTPSTLGGGGDEDERVEKLWFYIGMALGFVIGFWCIFGPLLFSKSWKIAYYKFLDNMMNRLRGSLQPRL